MTCTWNILNWQQSQPCRVWKCGPSHRNHRMRAEPLGISPGWRDRTFQPNPPGTQRLSGSVWREEWVIERPGRYWDLRPDQIKNSPVVSIVVISKVEHSALTIILNQPFQSCIPTENSFGSLLVCFSIRKCWVWTGEMNWVVDGTVSVLTFLNNN